MLRNKTLIVTGASYGIGSALAIVLSERGVNLVLNARNAAPLAQTATACRINRTKVVTVTGDAASATTARKLVAEAMDLGDFHGFVHAAGVFSPGPLLAELPKAKFDEIMNASVTAAFQLIHYATPHLRNTQDAMAVFFGAGAAEITQPGIGAYCAAKAAEEHLARQFAAEEPDVATLIYRPGIVETRMQEEARKAEGGGADALHAVYRSWKEEGRLITPQQAATYLADLLETPADNWRGKTIRVGD